MLTRLRSQHQSHATPFTCYPPSHATKCQVSYDPFPAGFRALLTRLHSQHQSHATPLHVLPTFTCHPVLINNSLLTQHVGAEGQLWRGQGRLASSTATSGLQNRRPCLNQHVGAAMWRGRGCRKSWDARGPSREPGEPIHSEKMEGLSKGGGSSHSCSTGTNSHQSVQGSSLPRDRETRTGTRSPFGKSCRRTSSGGKGDSGSWVARIIR